MAFRDQNRTREHGLFARVSCDHGKKYSKVKVSNIFPKYSNIFPYGNKAIHIFKRNSTHTTRIFFSVRTDAREVKTGGTGVHTRTHFAQLRVVLRLRVADVFPPRNKFRVGRVGQNFLVTL